MDLAGRADGCTHVGLEHDLRDLIAGIVRAEVARQLAEATMPDEFLTVTESAKVAKVAGRTIRRWVDSGRLAGVGAGRLLRVRRADIEALLRDGRRGRRRGHGDELTDAEIDRMAAELG